LRVPRQTFVFFATPLVDTERVTIAPEFFKEIRLSLRDAKAVAILQLIIMLGRERRRRHCEVGDRKGKAKRTAFPVDANVPVFIGPLGEILQG
jgi:hypothetical protein